MRLVIFFFVCAAFVGGAGRALADNPPDISGTWSANAGDKALPDTLVIALQPDSIQLTEKDSGAGRSTDIQCSTRGQECEIKGEAHAKTLFYFNGPTLVQTVYKGKNANEVLKRRYTLQDDGKHLNVEFIPVVPNGPVEKVIYAKK
jgi:hypothetical protein